MREATRGQVLAALLRSRPTSRKNVATATGVSAATVSRNVDSLIEDGLVIEGPALIEERRGRRQVLLDVEPDAHLTLGIDVGGSRTRCVLVDLVASPVASIEVDTEVGADSPLLAAWINSVARDLAGERWPHVKAVALGLPGAVDRTRRTVTNAPNLRQVEETSFLEECEGQLRVPLLVDNDANYALLGEMKFGAATGVANAAMVTLGAGLGVGLAVDGRLIQGQRGLVGEFGQLPVGPGGTRLESLVTGPGILEQARAAKLELREPADLFRHDEDRERRVLRSSFDHALVVTLAAVSVASDPDVIVLGGGIAKSLEGELERYTDALTATLHIAPALASSALGDFAGAAGAAAGALQHVYGTLGIDANDLTGLPAPGTLLRHSVEGVRRA